MRRLAAIAIASLIASSAHADDDVDAAPIVIGGKIFTEQVILTEMFALIIEERMGLEVERRPNLGGTLFCLEALKRGDIDLYPEYTGTAQVAVLHREATSDRTELWRSVTTGFRAWDITWLPPLAFSNSYTLTVTASTANRLRLSTMSDLVEHASELSMGASHEFIARPDGLPGLAKKYGLAFSEVRSVDPGLIYEAIRVGDVDVIDGYTTDGRIEAFGLVVLEDDRAFFPPYQVAPIVRDETLARHPTMALELSRLSGLVTDAEMRAMNHAVDRQGAKPQAVARAYLVRAGILDGRDTTAAPRRQSGLLAYMYSQRREILELTWEHIELCAIAIGLAVLFGVPFGVFLSRKEGLVGPSRLVINTIQTIPALALLGFLIPLFGIGKVPAIVALFLYALLPIVVNAYTGLCEVDAAVVEAARGVGMTPRQILTMVEIPLALPVMMTGIRTAAVISIATATLAALIGAGGLGEPIVRGIALADAFRILSGAIPAAGLALLADFLLGRVQRRFSVS